jgi:hypothetical protein
VSFGSFNHRTPAKSRPFSLYDAATAAAAGILLLLLLSCTLAYIRPFFLFVFHSGHYDAVQIFIAA